MTILPDAPPQTSSDEPLYNIGVVTRMTGISMATLRAWERRYNFPDAKRTSGGHRLYSEKDILRLRWVKDRIEMGMQTSQSINALRHLEESGQFLLEPGLKNLPISIKEDRASVLEQYSHRLRNALLENNLTLADQILGDALAGSSPERLIVEVIGPVLTDIGEAWEKEVISVANEHFATNYLRQRLLMWMVSGPPPFTRPPIILACAPGEWHEGSLLILGALLRRRRWPVAYLGQSLPLTDLASFIREIQPSLVILVAMTEETAANLVEWPQWMPEVAQKGKPIIGFGGRVFHEKPEWRIRVPGTYLGQNFPEGLATIEKLLQS